VANLGSTVYIATGAGSTSQGLCIGGNPPRTSVEEWNDPVYTIKTVTVS